MRDDQCDRIKEFLPGRDGHAGVTAEDNRLFVDAVLYRYRAGIPWRDLPERFFPWKNVIDNVTFGPVMQGKLSAAEAKDKARSMMADAGLSGTENNFPGELSSGVRRRVEIVRALMNDPAVLLLDEPYRALDSLTKSVMHESLLDIYYKNKVTIFFITHDLQEALFLGNKVAIMTSRPCKPKKVLTVDIPYPRSYSVVTDKRFRELMEETSEAVHEEAKKSFAAGEREG